MTSVHPSAEIVTRAGGHRGGKGIPQLHPFQIAFHGSDAAWSHHLLPRLIEALAPDFVAGHAKREESKPAVPMGRLEEADVDGSVTLTTNRSMSTRVSRSAPGPFDNGYALLDCDLVLAEGFAPGELSDSLGSVLLLDGPELPVSEQPPATSVIAAIGSREQASPPGVPYFDREDVTGLAELIAGLVTAAAAEVPLYGLVLAGGRSTRMGRPKWALRYRGEAHAVALHRTLERFCDRAFVSIRAEQEDEQELSAVPRIVDRFLDFGPLGGILSAMVTHPQAAWLVVACDLPYLDDDTLERLLADRAPSRFATSYRSPHDGLPEPLCAVYEPKARMRLFQAAGLGHRCPRKMLMNSRIALIESDDPLALTNANHPHEYQEAAARLQGEGDGHRE